MDEMVIVWVVVLVISLIVEIMSLGLTSIWFAAGAILPAVFAGFDLPVWLQVVTFVIVSLVLMVFTRPIAIKYFNRDRYKTNVESIIGKQAVVSEEINNMLGQGQAIVQGQEWSARSVEDNGIIKKDELVEVVSVSGVKLMVKKVKGE